MRLFDSVKMYLFLFSVLVIITVAKLRQLALGEVHSGWTGSDAKSLLVGLSTLFMLAYLPLLLRNISNRIERVGILLTEVLCVLWLAELLANLGIGWANIPHTLFVNTTLHCAVTLMAGVRLVQVSRIHEPSKRITSHPSAEARTDGIPGE